MLVLFLLYNYVNNIFYGKRSIIKMNKDLLFMLENGEEYIKGVYEANTKKVYFLYFFFK